MSLFLFIFFLIYGGMHLYLFFKIKAAFLISLPAGIPLAFFLLLMTVAPVAVRLLERAEHEPAAKAMALLGYHWMGLLFLFTACALALDAGRLFTFLFSLPGNRDLSPFLLSARAALLVPFFISLAICFYGHFEARDIVTERVTLRTDKLPAGIDRFRIAQISDLHLGLIIRDKYLKKIIEIVESEEPDILVSTGDLVDGMMADVNGLSDLIASVETPYGKYAVTGNHEYYAGIDHALDFTRRAGFVILRGAGATVSGIINIAGVNDGAGKSFGEVISTNERELLSTLPRERFTLLLKHRPDIEESATGLFDLQLSGHTHRGQIFPFNFLVQLSYSRIAGLYSLSRGSTLYTSRGSGTWGPPLRVLSPPEVTIIDILRHNQSERGE